MFIIIIILFILIGSPLEKSYSKTSATTSKTASRTHIYSNILNYIFTHIFQANKEKRFDTQNCSDQDEDDIINKSGSNHLNVEDTENDYRAELQKLREENRKLKLENIELKKNSSYGIENKLSKTQVKILI